MGGTKTGQAPERSRSQRLESVIALASDDIANLLDRKVLSRFDSEPGLNFAAEIRLEDGGLLVKFKEIIPRLRSDSRPYENPYFEVNFSKDVFSGAGFNYDRDISKLCDIMETAFTAQGFLASEKKYGVLEPGVPLPAAAF